MGRRPGGHHDAGGTSLYAVSPASTAVHASGSAEERQQAQYLDKELAQIDVAFPAVERVEQPLGHLHPRSNGCNPRARLDEPPGRGCRVPASPGGASREPGLVTAGSQSRGPSAGPWSLSGAQALVAREQKLGEP